MLAYTSRYAEFYPQERLREAARHRLAALLTPTSRPATRLLTVDSALRGPLAAVGLTPSAASPGAVAGLAPSIGRPYR